jgi:iron complex transport system ATP-binding protein
MELKNIVVSHDGTKRHLKGVSTSIQIGKITTILGPNGCGKSTLLGVMAKQNKLLDGQATLEMKDLIQYKQKEFAKKLAIVYQQNEVPEDLTVEKLVQFGRMPYASFLKSTSKEDEDAVEWALQRTNLIDKKHHPLTALSGGERQRVWIAMSLAQKTSILCLDEPTTYLDIFYQLELLQLIKQLNVEEGITIVMVLHDINQAIQYSDHLIVMKDGEIVGEGAPRDVITQPLMKDVYGVQVVFREDEELGYYLMPVNG